VVKVTQVVTYRVTWPQAAAVAEYGTDAVDLVAAAIDGNEHLRGWLLNLAEAAMTSPMIAAGVE
jgi:hypothetical protein